MEGHTEPVALAVDTTRSVSGLWRRPPKARACFVLAHGAGAGMTNKARNWLMERFEVT